MSSAHASGGGAARAPIFADANLLIHAAERGHVAALAEIRAGPTWITPAQLREFLSVRTSAQRAARRSFLQREQIQVFSGPQASQVTQTRLFQDTYQQVFQHQGHGDALLAAFAKTTGYEAVTMERRLYNLLTHTLRQLRIPIRRVQ